MNETDLIAKKERIENIVKGILLFAALAVIGPVVFLAVKGIVGLMIAGGLGLITINTAPVIAEWFSDWRLKAIKMAAMANPIETLQLDYAQRQEALGRFKDNIKTFDTSVRNFQDKLEGFKIKFPKDTAKFQDTYDKMHQLLDLRKRKYKDAEKTLALYDGEIDKAKAIWEMGQEAAKMNQAAGMKEDYMAKIKVETALDSVTTSLNSAMSDLETSLIEEDAEKALLEHKDIIDVPVIEKKEKVGK